MNFKRIDTKVLSLLGYAVLLSIFFLLTVAVTPALAADGDILVNTVNVTSDGQDSNTLNNSDANCLIEGAGGSTTGGVEGNAGGCARDGL